MSSNALLDRSHETRFLESMRARYEQEGFRFTVEPQPPDLPHFFGSFRPDAIAQKDGRNIAIEIKRTVEQRTGRDLMDIRKLFEGQTDWQFRVFFAGSDPLQSLMIETFDRPAILARLDEVRLLTRTGFLQPAFIMAWSTLEAVVRTHAHDQVNHALTAGSVVQTLATQGLIEPETERTLRGLIELRDRIVHGDLSAKPKPSDIEAVLSAIDETLQQELA